MAMENVSCVFISCQFILSAIYSLIHVHHLFTTHKTCIPSCLKWQRSLKYVNYVFMRTGKTQASQHAN